MYFGSSSSTAPKSSDERNSFLLKSWNLFQTGLVPVRNKQPKMQPENYGIEIACQIKL